MADTNEGALPVVAYQYQHDETGRTGFVDQWQLDNGWRHMNPRLLVGPALTDHATATALIEDLRRQLAAVQVGAERSRWSLGGVPSAWRLLYETANQVTAHIGADGQIDSRHPACDRLMDALHALDGGIYRDDIAKEPA